MNLIHDRTRSYKQTLIGPKKLTCSQWADEYRLLSEQSSSEPGPWKTSRTPYLKAIMDDLSVDSSLQNIVLMKGAQIGGTECGQNWIGYIIDQAPGPMLVVQPTVELAKRFSKQRLAPLIDSSPCLNTKVKPARSRDSGNTLFSKEFPGGVLMLTGANSAVGLRSMPVRYLFLDEIDGYPGELDGEGDPVDLAIGRTRTFAQRKIFMVSTPTINGRSRIEQAFANSDQHYYFIPCPHCNHLQILMWKQLRWEKSKPQTVKYHCEVCDKPIEEKEKLNFLNQGKWIAKQPQNKIRGYHLSSLYSPYGWYSWEQAVTDWERAQGIPQRLQVFINTVLGETWQERGEAPDWQRLYLQRESYTIGEIPEKVALLTAGIDVQRDRLECSIVGWYQQQAWLIDHIIIAGDPLSEKPWNALNQVLNKSWDHSAGGALNIQLATIDSGFLTGQVYQWVREQGHGQVVAIKGHSHLLNTVGTPRSADVNLQGRRITRGVRVWPVGVDALKVELYRRLKMKSPTQESLKTDGYPSAFIHFPQLSEAYFKQLTAERMIPKLKNGYRSYRWEKHYPQNEALDCFIYAMAAYNILGAHRWEKDYWQQQYCGRYGAQGTTPTNVIKRRQSKFWSE